MKVFTSPLPVFSEVDQNGDMTGYSVESARNLLKFSWYESEFVALPFDQLMKRVDGAESLIATGVGRIPERENDFF